MTYKFYETDGLGTAVQNVKPFCKLLKQMGIPDEKYIVGDYAQPEKFPGLAGRKWSRLCGFTFKSKDGQLFQFVFVPKLKGTLSRNQKALSGWYCWTLYANDKDNKQVTSIADIKKRFGFDINKFVHSDLFEKYVEMFQQNVSHAIEHQVKDLLSQSPDKFEDYTELQRYANAVKDSIPKMLDVQKTVTLDDMYNDENNPDYAKGSAPKVGHAKIAYNADKTYNLRNTGKQAQADELKRRAIEKIANKTEEPMQDNATQPAEEAPIVKQPKKTEHIKYDPSLKHKFGGGRTKKSDAEIFDKYDDYDDSDVK